MAADTPTTNHRPDAFDWEALIDEWCNIDAMHEEADENGPQAKALLEELLALERLAARTPARGLRELALKIRLLGVVNGDDWSPGDLTDDITRSLIADAERLLAS